MENGEESELAGGEAHRAQAVDMCFPIRKYFKLRYIFANTSGGRRRRRRRMPRLNVLAAATPVVNRRALLSRPSNGHAIFIPQNRKLVFEYCDVWPSSSNLRRYIYNHVEDLAREHPHVEFVVKQRPSKEPVIRGLYRTLSEILFCIHSHRVSEQPRQSYWP